MVFLVTSAAGKNGEGYGALLAFDADGRPLGTFSDDARISDPRGLAVNQSEGLVFLNSGSDRVLALNRHGKVVRDTGPIANLNPGGGVFAPDGRYCITLRSAGTIMALAATLLEAGKHLLPPRIVRFPRGFAFDGSGRLLLASGIGPGGEGDNTVIAFSGGPNRKQVTLISDPDLSPLDLAIAPNGNIVVSSEHPFGSADAVTSVREYAAADGRLLRIFSAGQQVEFRKPRGLRFGDDGTLYCVAQDEVMAFDFATGQCLGAVVRRRGLHGQAVALLPIELDTNSARAEPLFARSGA
jgi:DNA-binding beta-propeller fold protein YncE